MIVRNNLTLTAIDGENYPEFKAEMRPSIPIGKWGRRHAFYLRHFQPEKYDKLVRATTLFDYLELVDHKANQRFDQLIGPAMDSAGATKELKRKDRSKWLEKEEEAYETVTDMLFDEILFTKAPVTQKRLKQYIQYKETLSPGTKINMEDFERFVNQE